MVLTKINVMNKVWNLIPMQQKKMLTQLFIFSIILFCLCIKWQTRCKNEITYIVRTKVGLTQSKIASLVIDIYLVLHQSLWPATSACLVISASFCLVYYLEPNCYMKHPLPKFLFTWTRILDSYNKWTLLCDFLGTRKKDCYF